MFFLPRIFKTKATRTRKTRQQRLCLEQLERRELLTISLDWFVLPSSAGEGESVAPYAIATGGVGPLNYSWNFGDGGSASQVDLRAPEHVYDTNDPPTTPYTVTLTVSDGMESVSRTGTILINNLAPTVDAGPSQVVYQAISVTFAGQASDPGISTGDITAIEWDFNYQGTFTTDSSGSLDPNYVYSAPGAYLVALRVTDRAGAASLAFITVDVRSLGP